MPRMMVVDANNQYLRAYITNPTLSPNGQPVGGVVGFLKIMQKLCSTINPDLIYVCWDGEGGSKKRKLMNSNYKDGRNPLRLNRDVRNLTENEEIANRIWQQTRVAEYFNQMPVIQLLYPNIEADDLVSYVVKHEHYKRWQKVVVSSDKDFIQLIDDKTILYRPIQEELLNVSKIIEKYGIHPNNFALARAIAGDDSDNLKGVRGVGMTTIAKKIPMLLEEKSYLANDVTEFCKDKEGKAFESIASSFEVIRDNYRIMQLSSPQISYQTKQHIDELVENFEPQLNQLEFRRMSMQDGFGVVDFSSLMTCFKKIVANNTT